MFIRKANRDLVVLSEAKTLFPGRPTV